MAKTLPPMMQVMRDIGGIELPEALVKLGGDSNGEERIAASADAAVSAGDGKAADDGASSPK